MTFATLLLSPLTSIAQEMRAGGFLGLASVKSRVSGQQVAGSSSSSGIMLGASLEREITEIEVDNLYLQIDPMYIRKSSGPSIAYLYVPVLAKYKYPKEIFQNTTIAGLAGLAPSMRLSSLEGGKTFGLNLDFGGEVEHQLNNYDFDLFFSTRYSLGLTKAASIDNYSLKFNSLQFMLGARIDF